MSYARTANLEVDIADMISGDLATADFNTIANKGVLAVLSDVDLRTTRRSAALSPNMFDEIFQYTCPTSMKDMALIDLKPQIKRGRFDYWRLTTEEEFDRYKKEHRTDQFGDPINIKGYENWLGDNLVAISDKDMVRKLLISRPISDNESVISELDSLTSGGGTWAAYGDGTNVTVDSDDYIKGSASLNWDINADGGTTAGIYNDDINDFDVSDYLTEGSIFCWAYITSITNLTNYVLRIGSSASNYYSITITTSSEGNSFVNGYNLLRFDFVNKSETGTVDDDGCDYIALYMTKDGAKVSETDYRFDWLVMKRGDHYNVIYYSKYGWQSSTGTWLENATADTDILNAETSEYDLISEKVAELAEQKLKNYKQADRHAKEYEKKRLNYIFNYPSERMLLEQSYFDLTL